MRSWQSASFRILQVLIIIVVGCRPLACSGSIIRHDRQAEQFRALGKLEAFRCVVRVGVKPLGRPVMFGGNAVLITPQWVLTAGHVAMSAPLKRLRFRFGDEEFRAVRVVPHPGFNAAWKKEPTVVVGGEDLALVHLDRPVSDIQPAIRYRGENEVGKTVTKIGDGAVGDGKAGLKRPLTFERRGCNNVIDAAGATIGDLKVSKVVLLFDFDDPDDPSGNQFGGDRPLELEGAVSKGDSGGGWFIRDDGKWKLVAITSRRLPPSGDLDDDPILSDLYGTISVGMRVSSANTWIDEVIGR